MSALVIVQLRFTDEVAYRAYEQAAVPTLARYGARLLALDDAPQVLEGDYGFQRVIVLEFASEAEALICWRSPEYQRLAPRRRAGAAGPIVMVRARPSFPLEKKP